MTDVIRWGEGPQRLREAIYGGALVALDGGAPGRALLAEVRGLLVELLGTEDIQRAQFLMDNDHLQGRLRQVRGGLEADPRFRQGVLALMAHLGLGPEGYAVDALRLRAVVDGGHRIEAAKAAYTLHRDTWYANPRSQINAWIPLHPLPRAQSFGFFPQHFGVEIPNDSGDFDHAQFMAAVGWQGRARAEQPPVYPTTPLALGDDEAVRFELDEGAVLLFSAAHLHRTMPNNTGLTRFSVDFRLVCLDDLRAGRGAPDPDNASRGDAMVGYTWGAPVSSG